MMVAGRTPADGQQFDRHALGFLASEFVDDRYQDWPIERRLEAYLRHQGLSTLANAGGQFERLLDRVMVNFARARRDGIFGKLTGR